MDSLETNKIVASVLMAGILFVGAGLLSDALVRPAPLAKTAIQIDLPPPPGGAAPAAAPEEPIEARLVSANPDAGKADTLKQGCIACHTFNEGGHAGVGPNLYGVVGAPHGHMPGFAYSAALKAHDGPWTYDELDKWLTKPAAYAPGTKMTFAGVADPKVRADLIDYLRSNAANPEPLPAAPAAGSAAGSAPSPGPAPIGATPAGSTKP